MRTSPVNIFLVAIAALQLSLKMVFTRMAMAMQSLLKTHF
jgi:hypothetical protein